MEAWSINSAATLDHTGLKHQSIYSCAILLWNEQHAHVSITCTMEWVVDLKNVSCSLKFCSLSHFLSLLYPTSGTFIIHFTGRPEKCNYIPEELRVSSLCVVFFGREDGLYIWLEKNTGIINTWRWNSQHGTCRWRCTGVIMVAMMIRMRAWAFQRMAIISETQSSPSSNVSNTTGDVTKLLHSGKLYTILSSFNLLNFIVGCMFISTFPNCGQPKRKESNGNPLTIEHCCTHPPSLHIQKFRSVS